MHGEYKEYKELLKERLNEKRYYHSLCVADEAYRLAQKYGADTEKAYLSGLLHDITKNAHEKEHRQIFTKYGVKLTKIEDSAEKLWHGISGAYFVKFELDIKDDDIFDAIRYHTTAKEDMNLLTTVLYLADFTSADRDYDDVDVMRRLVDESMDKALLYALSYTVKDLAYKSKAIHPDTIKAYNNACLKGL